MLRPYQHPPSSSSTQVQEHSLPSFAQVHWVPSFLHWHYAVGGSRGQLAVVDLRNRTERTLVLRLGQLTHEQVPLAQVQSGLVLSEGLQDLRGER
jgi:hypothetical protein